jgi:hypothetical protein
MNNKEALRTVEIIVRQCNDAPTAQSLYQVVQFLASKEYDDKSRMSETTKQRYIMLMKYYLEKKKAFKAIDSTTDPCDMRTRLIEFHDAKDDMMEFVFELWETGFLVTK